MSGSRIHVGIASCLLGQTVRWDGGHKRDAFLVSELGRFVEWLPVCPEVESGMGVPRPSVRLVRTEGEIQMVENETGRDHTRTMRAHARRRAAELVAQDLCGYVLKKDSPSCGMERVRVYRSGAPAARDGRGLFAEALLMAMPWLPVEEEGRLNDAPKAYAELGRQVAGMKQLPRRALRERYQADFMAALTKRATPGRNANALEHMSGYLRDRLDAADRAELAGLIRDHRAGLAPLLVPLTRIRHHARRLGIAYLLGQVWLDPHPKELMLRNHV